MFCGRPFLFVLPFNPPEAGTIREQKRSFKAARRRTREVTEK
jgi:hypothetical protein